MRAVRQAGNTQSVERALAAAIYNAVPFSTDRSPIDVWVVGYDGWLRQATVAEAARPMIRGDASRHFRLVFIREPISGRITLPVDDLSGEYRSLGLVMKTEGGQQPFSRLALRSWRRMEDRADRLKRDQGSTAVPSISEILREAGLPYVHHGDTAGGHATMS